MLDELQSRIHRVKRTSPFTAVAKEIMRAPESADDILARYDLDREGLDELIYKISADSSLRQRYSEQLTARE